MKKMIAAFFAAGLMMTACGGSSDDAAETVAEDTSSDASAATESTDEAAADEAAADEADENDEAEASDEAESSDGDLSDDELALATALTATATAGGDSPFPDSEIQCANERIVQTIGLDALNGYGITVDNPDDTLLPEEYELQRQAVESITDCVDIGAAFRALAPPECEIPLSDDEMEMAMTYDFLSEFPEYDDPAAMAASEAMNTALLACN